MKKIVKNLFIFTLLFFVFLVNVDAVTFSKRYPDPDSGGLQAKIYKTVTTGKTIDLGLETKSSCIAQGGKTGSQRYYLYRRYEIWGRRPSPSGWSCTLSTNGSTKVLMGWSSYSTSSCPSGTKNWRCCLTNTSFSYCETKRLSPSSCYSVKETKYDTGLPGTVGWARADSNTYYKCTKRQQVTQTNRSVLNLASNIYYQTDTDNDAFCIQPGKAYSSEEEYHLEESFAINNCKKSNSSFECGLASILQAAQSDKIGYIPTLTALRLWTAYKGLQGDGWWEDEGDLTVKEEMFLNTAKAIMNSNYQGTTENSNGLIYATSAIGKSNIGQAFKLFKDNASGNLPAVTSGAVTPTSNKVNLSNGPVVIELQTNFNEHTTLNITATNGVTTESLPHEKKRCPNDPSKYCLYVTVSKATCDISSFNLNIQASGMGGSTINIQRYRPEHSAFQIMMVYNKKPVSQTVSFSVQCDPPVPVCTNPSLDPNSEIPNTCNNQEQVTAKYSDPPLDNLLKACPNNQTMENKYLTNTYQFCKIYCRETIDFKLFGKVKTQNMLFKYDIKNSYSSPYPNTLVANSTKQCFSEIDFNSWIKRYTAENINVEKYGYQTPNQEQYEGAVNRREQLIREIQNCNLYPSVDGISETIYQNIASNYKDTFDPKFNVSYEDTESGDTVLLERTIESKGTEETKWCNGTDCADESKFNTNNVSTNVEYWTCTSGKCKMNYKSIPMNTRALISTNIEAGYYQNQEYSIEAYTGAIKIKKSVSGDNYTDLPEKYVYPVGISVEPDLYDIKLDIKELGFSKYNTTYKCQYEVGDNITTGSTLGFFFRTIDLSKIFPSNREIGSNWKDAISIINEIENLNENIWTEKTPLYSFTLTPSNISAIRNYNKNKENLNLGYFDMSLDCSPRFTKCRSRFLTNILTEGYASEASLAGRSR